MLTIWKTMKEGIIYPVSDCAHTGQNYRKKVSKNQSEPSKGQRRFTIKRRITTKKTEQMYTKWCSNTSVNTYRCISMHNNNFAEYLINRATDDKYMLFYELEKVLKEFCKQSQNFGVFICYFKNYNSYVARYNRLQKQYYIFTSMPNM